MQEAPPGAAVEVWAADEHRIGLKPIVRVVWAPRGKRSVVDLHPRYRWRSLSGFVHPPAGRTQWHFSSNVSVELFASSLRHFAQQAEVGPDKQVVLVLDRGAGTSAARRLAVPEHLHLVLLPPYTPELQPAERLWSFSDAPLVNARRRYVQQHYRRDARRATRWRRPRRLGHAYRPLPAVERDHILRRRPS